MSCIVFSSFQLHSYYMDSYIACINKCEINVVIVIIIIVRHLNNEQIETDI